MADFVAVLKKTIAGLSNNTPEARERVYQKARDTIGAKLAAMDPQPSKIVVDRQKKALEDAISAVESGFAEAVESSDEFEAIFAGTEKKPEAKPAGDDAIAEETPEEEPKAAPKPEVTAEAEPEPGAAEATLASAGAGAKSAQASPEAKKSADAPQPTAKADADGKDASEALTPVTPAAKPIPELPGATKAEDAPKAARPKGSAKKRGSGGLIAAVIVLLVVAAAGYGVWLNRDAFMSMFASTDEVAATSEEGAATSEEPAEETTSEETAAEETNEAAATEEPAANETPAAEEPQKFTQRLTPEGGEVDAGPAGGEPSVGEGTSVASATQQGGEASAGEGTSAPAPASEPTIALPVGQRAIFYEERTTVADSTAEPGATVWSVVQESPGGELPAEPVIRAEVTVPSRNLRLRMTISRNADPSLPASHIIEMIFLNSDGFEGGGIDNVLRVAMKPTEAAAGNPLIGIPAKIADGYFLIALSNLPEERAFNLQLMRQQSWIDIPIVYASGRRALVTMERGVPGDKAFVDVLATWNNIEAAAAAEAAPAEEEAEPANTGN
ncbi:MAG: hypothetical protein JJ969_09600 [Rhizobiaceae bacterium]|nr:hypothetical protein [Rhizobiaceae bacterium]